MDLYVDPKIKPDGDDFVKAIEMQVRRECPSLFRMIAGKKTAKDGFGLEEEKEETSKAKAADIVLVMYWSRVNDIPLMSYLSDCNSRYRLENDSHKATHEFISECKGFKELQKKNEIFANALKSAVNLYQLRLIAIFGDRESITAQIDDSYADICQYIMGFMQKAVDLKNAKNGQLLPMQIDVLIIPKNKMVKRSFFEQGNELDDDDDEDEEEDEKNKDGVSLPENIGHSLSSQKVLKCDVSGEDIVANLDKKMGEIGVNKRSRLVVVIDRRSEEKSDEMYIYQPSDHGIIFDGKYFPESFQENSLHYLIPENNSKSQKKKFFKLGASPVSKPHSKICVNSENVLCLSFHIHQQDVLRSYIFMSGGYFRFKIEDAISFLPRLFTKERVQTDADFVTGLVNSMPHLHGFHDNYFENFYKSVMPEKMM